MTMTSPPTRTHPLDRSRLRQAKRAFTTRYIDLGSATALLADAAPRTGDLLLAKVVAIGQHKRLELPDGRRAALFPGDEVVLSYGHRYAPDQFEAVVPDDLGPCELVAAGGVAARVQASHAKMAEATSLAPVGLLADARGQRLNLLDGAPIDRPRVASSPRPVTLAVAGSAMNAGKTTAAAHLVRGLAAAGLRVGAAKVTGTGAGGDTWLLADAGAFPVYDFTSTGLATTYRVGHDQVRRVFTDLTDQLASDGCEVLVLEIADGVYQEETAALLEDPLFAERVDALVFAAVDALGARAGQDWLRARGLSPIAFSGLLSASPLSTREAEAVTGRPVWDLDRLSCPDHARELASSLRAARAA